MTTTTDQTLANADKIFPFIRAHKGELGPLSTIDSYEQGVSVQVYTSPRATPNPNTANAAALLGWFYRLTDKHIEAFKTREGAHVTVAGKLDGLRVRAYTGLEGAAGELLLANPSVHALRNLQAVSA